MHITWYHMHSCVNVLSTCCACEIVAFVGGTSWQLLTAAKARRKPCHTLSPSRTAVRSPWSVQGSDHRMDRMDPMEEWLHRRQRLSNHGIITWPPPPPLWRLEPTERQGTWAWSFSSFLSVLFCDILWQLETTCDCHVFRVELLLRRGGRRTYRLSHHQKLIPSVGRSFFFTTRTSHFAEANAPDFPRFQRRDSTQRRGSSVIWHEKIGEQMDYRDNIYIYTFIYVCVYVYYIILLYYAFFVYADRDSQA